MESGTKQTPKRVVRKRGILPDEKKPFGLLGIDVWFGNQWMMVYSCNLLNFLRRRLFTVQVGKPSMKSPFKESSLVLTFNSKIPIRGPYLSIAINFIMDILGTLKKRPNAGTWKGGIFWSWWYQSNPQAIGKRSKGCDKPRKGLISTSWQEKS